MYDNYSKLLGLINRLFRKDPAANELCRSAGDRLDHLETDAQDAGNQLLLDTATWALDVFERELGIETVRLKPVSERRAVISAKWRGTGKSTLDLIKRTVDAYVEGDAKVRFSGYIEIELDTSHKRGLNVEDVYKTIWTIKPAHLPLRLKSTSLLPDTRVFACAYVGGPVRITRLGQAGYHSSTAVSRVVVGLWPVSVYKLTKIGGDCIELADDVH